MQWEEVGAYLGRVVRVAGLRATSSFPSDVDAADTVLMLCFQYRLSCEAHATDLFRRIGLALPLAVKVHGPEAAALFGRLVEHFDAERPLLHIMTGLCHGSDAREAVEEFLGATWPSEERFDDWRSYSILIFGDVEFHDGVTRVVRAVVSGDSSSG